MGLDIGKVTEKPGPIDCYLLAGVLATVVVYHIIDNKIEKD